MNARRIVTLAAALFVGSAFTSGVALAQDDGERKVQYKQRTEIDFEGVEVAGELVKPNGALLLDRKRANFNPLIKLRQDFNEEMDQSVNQVK